MSPSEIRIAACRGIGLLAPPRRALEEARRDSEHAHRMSDGPVMMVGLDDPVAVAGVVIALAIVVGGCFMWEFLSPDY